MKMRFIIGAFSCFIFATQVFTQIKLPFIVAQQKEYYNEIATIAKAGYTGCKIYHHEIADGKVVPEKYLDRIIKYHPDGRIKEIEFKTPEGSVESVDIYYYFPNKLPKSITTFSINGQELHKEVYRYANSGHLSELVEYDTYGYILSKIVVTTDSLQNKVCAAKYISPDEIEWKNCYYFSGLSTGRLYAREDYAGKDDFMNKRIIAWENNKMISETVYLADSSVAYRLTYEYNNAGDNSVVYVTEPSKKPIEIIRYNYNPLHLVIGTLESDFNGQIKKMIKKQSKKK